MPIQPPPGFRGRHAQEAPLPAAVGFRCPACGEQNTGPIDAGCQYCGAGTQRATHVEEPPAMPMVDALDAQGPPPVARVEQLISLDAAFLAWVRPFRGKYPSEVEQLLYMAFKAGYEFHQTTTAAPALKGTAESRTILAALQLFVDNALPHLTEEIASGELLSIEETQKLIRRLEQTH